MIEEAKLLQIEKELSDSLLKLKPVHGFAAHSLIKDRVLQVYELGIKYVSAQLNVKVNLNREDFRIIDRIATDAFRNWRYGHRLDSALVRVTSVALAQSIKAKVRQIRLASRIRLVTAASFDRDILLNLMPPSIMFSEDQELTDLEDIEIDTFTTLPITDEELGSRRLVWNTMQDDRVCNICEPLDGEQYELDDPDIPTPVLETHPNCRCRLVLVQL